MKIPVFPDMRIAVAVVALLLVTGCASTHHGAAKITSNPSGMEVIDMHDGSLIGVTPVTYLWRSKDVKRKYMNIRLHKNNEADVVRSFWLNLDHDSADDARAHPQNVQIDVSKSTE